MCAMSSLVFSCGRNLCCICWGRSTFAWTWWPSVFLIRCIWLVVALCPRLRNGGLFKFHNFWQDPFTADKTHVFVQNFIVFLRISLTSGFLAECLRIHDNASLSRLTEASFPVACIYPSATPYTNCVFSTLSMDLLWSLKSIQARHINVGIIMEWLVKLQLKAIHSR